MGCSSSNIYFKKNGEILIDDEVFENIAKIYEKEGSDCWFEENFQDFLEINIKQRILINHQIL